MDLICIFGQQHESYPGQYAPTLLDASTEYDHEDFPDFLNNRLKEHSENPEYISVKMFRVVLNPAAQEWIRTTLLETSLPSVHVVTVKVENNGKLSP